MPRSRWAGLALLLLAGCASQPPVPPPEPLSWRITPPPAGTPDWAAAFSGVWVGRWTDFLTAEGAGATTTAHTLIVEWIAPTGDNLYQAHVIFAWDGAPGPSPKGMFRTVGTISPHGDLKLPQFENGHQHTYTLARNKQMISIDSRGHFFGMYVMVSGTLWRRSTSAPPATTGRHDPDTEPYHVTDLNAIAGKWTGVVRSLTGSGPLEWTISPDGGVDVVNGTSTAARKGVARVQLNDGKVFFEGPLSSGTLTVQGSGPQRRLIYEGILKRDKSPVAADLTPAE